MHYYYYYSYYYNRKRHVPMTPQLVTSTVIGPSPISITMGPSIRMLKERYSNGNPRGAVSRGW